MSQVIQRSSECGPGYGNLGGMKTVVCIKHVPPTPIELIIVLGVVSLVVLAFIVLTRRFVGGSGKDASIPARTATDQAA